MAIEQPNNSEELSGAPLADMIHAVAVAIADGQFQLDKASLRAAEFMSGQVLLRDMDSGRLLTLDGHETDVPTLVDTRVYFGYSYDADGNRQANRLSMMELGFVPAFYQFVDTVIDMKLTLRVRRQSSETRVLKETWSTEQSVGSEAAGRSRRSKPKTVITTTPVDARYSSSYNFSAEMTSKISTKLVPVPPPAILEERIRALMDQERLDRDRKTQESAEKASRNLSKQPLGGPVFDGTCCYEIEDVNLSKAPVARAFTVEAWVSASPEATGARAGVVGVWMDDEKAPKGWLLGVIDKEFCFALTSRGSSKATLVTARGGFSLDQWHHLAAVYDGAEMRVYVDGRLRNGSADQSGDIAYPDQAHLVIGAYEYHDGLVPFSGCIDEVRLWDRALKAVEIKSNMGYRLTGGELGLIHYWRLDHCRDDVVPDVGEKKSDAQKRPIYFKVMELEGATFGTKEAVLDCGEIDLAAGSFTVEFWANQNKAKARMLAIFQGKAEDNKGLFVGFRETDVFMFAFHGNDLNTDATYPQTGEWHHWACVYDKTTNTRAIFRDGEKIKEDQPKAPYQGTGKLVVGAQYNARGDYINQFDGQLANVRVWQIKRTQSEIRRAMRRHLSAQTKGLVVNKALGRGV